MFENLNSLSVSGAGRSAPRLEALEDRTTPAVVGPATAGFGAAGLGAAGLGAAGVSTAAIDNVSFSAASALDRAFVAEVGRLSLMQAFLGTVAADRASDPQVRAFGAQLAADQFALFQRVSPLVTQGGLNVQLTAIDRALIGALPTLSGADLDAQFLAFSGFYGLQAAGLSQFGSAFGSGAVRSFAGSSLTALQTQLQTGFDLSGAGAFGTTFGMFSAMGGFGPFTSSGLGTAGFNATGAFNSPFNTGFGATGFNTFGTVGGFNGTGFGPGASFGASTGFGPANTTTGFGGGFGPASTTGGFNSSGFGPGSSFGTTSTGAVGTTGTGRPIF